jgi:hypothetical protein
MPQFVLSPLHVNYVDENRAGGGQASSLKPPRTSQPTTSLRKTEKVSSLYMYTSIAGQDLFTRYRLSILSLPMLCSLGCFLPAGDI